MTQSLPGFLYCHYFFMYLYRCTSSTSEKHTCSNVLKDCFSCVFPWISWKTRPCLYAIAFFGNSKPEISTTYFIIIYFDLHSIFTLLSIHKHFQLKNGGSTYCICTYLLTSYNKLIQCIMVKWGKRRLLDIVWGATWWKMGSKIGFLSRNYAPLSK